MNQYYVYFLIDPRTCQPFYVGKGYGRRMYSHETEARSGNWNNKAKCQVIQEIWNMGLQVEYVKVVQGLNKKSANEKEKQFINYYGRQFNNTGILTNVHVGGNGGGKIGIPVNQYTKEGNFVAEYASAAEASRQTGVSLGEITAVCRGEWKTSNGYQWRWKGEDPIKGYKRKHQHLHKAVKQYDMDGTFINSYPSQYDAAEKAGLSCIPTKISACCRKKLPSYKGFQWRYFNDEPPPKIKTQKKKILQLSKDNLFIAEFESIADAARKTGIKQSSISPCCRGITNQGGGFVWKYKEN